MEKKNQGFGTAPWGVGPFPPGDGGITIEQLEAISELLNNKPGEDEGKKKELEDKVKRLTEELKKK